MKWFVLSMSVMSTFARLSVFAAVIPPNPPPMITTRGRTVASGKSFLERACGERHEQHQEYQQNTVGRRGPERQSAKLRQNLHRDRSVRVRVQHDARYELANGGDGRQ